MPGRTLTLRIPSETARAYELASAEERQRLDDALRTRLRELTGTLPSAAGDAAQVDPAARARPETGIHPEVSKISGLVPQDLDARAEYRAYLLKKHR